MQQKFSYPLMMRRGEWPSVQGRIVHSAEEESEARSQGWHTRIIKEPQPAEAKPPLNAEDRIAALEQRLAALEQRAFSEDDEPEAPRVKRKYTRRTE